MADLLKYMYNPVFFEKILPVMKESLPGFREREFIYNIFDSEWPDLELKQRVRKISASLRFMLPDDFPEAAANLSVLSHSFREKRICVQGFELIFIPEYIGMYGCPYVEDSLEALREITRLVSGEFAIRPFLNLAPELTISALQTWAEDPDKNVRRLASEGCRPRLPWGMGVPWLKKNPERILPILEKLKADPSPYVRRSVANNLNDIAKDHPNLVRATAKKWKGTHPLTDEIVKHGCRTLFKKGDPESLRLHGLNPRSKTEITMFRLSDKKINVGGDLRFDLRVKNSEKKTTRFRVDYAIDFRTGSGRTSTRVFRLLEKPVESNDEIAVSKKQSFRDLTTRKHFPGKHTIHIIVNGQRKVSEDFVLV